MSFRGRAVPGDPSDIWETANVGSCRGAGGLGKGKLDIGGTGLDEVVDVLRDFLMPAPDAIAAGQLLEMAWPPSGPWQPL